DWINRYQDNAAPIDVAGLKGINVSGSLHAGEIRIAKLDARKLAAGIKIEQSVLTVEPLTARLYGGTMTGRFSLAAQDKPQIAFRQNLKAFQMSAMLADTASAGKLAGKGDLAVDLSAEGGSVGALRKTLNGSVSLSLGRGSLQGIDLRSALIEGTDDLGTGSKPRVHPALFTEKTDFSELKAVFDIKDDTSHGNDFDMRSPQFRIAGEGDLALDTGKIDYQLTATVASKLTRRNAGELAELKAVSVPVRVSGPWAAPSIALDFGAASGGIVTKRLAAKAAEQAAAAKPAAPTKKRAAKKAERPG
ncbi:MAG: AsmA-like C-terminal region-containing protein, partial [Gallionella sp.]